MYKKIIILIGISLILIESIYILNNKYKEYKFNIYKDNIITNIKYIDNKDMDYITIDGIDYIGYISIPKINIELPIIKEWSDSLLEISPNRYYGSIYTNDLIICAHSYINQFKNIELLNIKDIIIITDINNKEYKYEVSYIELINGDDIEGMINSNYDLTLFTCNSDGLKRITIRCIRI